MKKLKPPVSYQDKVAELEGEKADLVKFIRQAQDNNEKLTKRVVELELETVNLERALGLASETEEELLAQIAERR